MSSVGLVNSLTFTRLTVVVATLLLSVLANAQVKNTLSLKETCKQFTPSVVRISVDGGEATGFIVSSDGWIMTAAHVVLDEQGHQRAEIAVMLPDGTNPSADVIVVNQKSAIQDFALLKVKAEGLPVLAIGSVQEIVAGSEVTIIGYPFSAHSPRYIPSTPPKFCLSGYVAAKDLVAQGNVSIDAIFFQGPAIKGISGAPVIARDTGHVVGIQSEKLAAISSALFETERRLKPPPGTTSGGVETNGVNQTDAIREVIEVLDQHLANGLGVATGIDDAFYALKQAKREYDLKHPKK
jgi:S1-C subfamily serine protease